MTNSYIKSVLEKGTFNVSSSFKLFGEMKTCEFKIDTGCSKKPFLAARKMK